MKVESLFYEKDRILNGPLLLNFEPIMTVEDTFMKNGIKKRGKLFLRI